MDRFIFKEHKGGILHVLGNGKTVFYDYDKIAAMKPVIDKYLAQTPAPYHHADPEYRPLLAVER